MWACSSSSPGLPWISSTLSTSLSMATRGPVSMWEAKDLFDVLLVFLYMMLVFSWYDACISWCKVYIFWWDAYISWCDTYISWCCAYISWCDAHISWCLKLIFSLIAGDDANSLHSLSLLCHELSLLKSHYVSFFKIKSTFEN